MHCNFVLIVASTSGRATDAWQQRPHMRAHPSLPQQLSRNPLLPCRSLQPGASRHRAALQVVALKPKGTMSLQQRLRVLRNVMSDRVAVAGAALRALPPVAAILQVLALLDRKLQPLYAVVELLKQKAEELQESYNNFEAEETKRRWSWENKHEEEIGFWKAVPPYFFFLVCTVVYELFVPVSVLVALVLPLYYAWVGWDRWWVSPVFLGLLLITPLKFVPWAEICWVWPGLI